MHRYVLPFAVLGCLAIWGWIAFLGLGRIAGWVWAAIQALAG